MNAPKSTASLTGVRDWFARLYEVDDSPSRIVPMEGMRGVAVLLVFFVHYYSVFGGDPALPGFVFGHFLSVVGNSGVDLFFVISGFLIYGAFVRRTQALRPFLWRRVMRIYPTYIAVFAIYVGLSLLFPAQSKLPTDGVDRALYLIANFFLLPGIKIGGEFMITVAWSLTFEFMFYLALPVLIMLLGARDWSRSARMSAIVLASVFLIVFCRLGFDSGYARLAFFGAGMLVYEWTSRREGRERGWRDVLVVLLFAGSLALYNATVEAGGWPFLICLLVQYAVFALFTEHLIRGGALAGVLSWAPIRYLGNMSYSYYLIHGLTLLAFGTVVKRYLDVAAEPVRFWSVLPLAFGVTWIAASVLFLCVEKPLSLKKRYPKRREMTVPPAGAATARTAIS